MNDIARATVYKAIAGYGPHKRYHKKRSLAARGELPILEGIVVLSNFDVIKYTHGDADQEVM